MTKTPTVRPENPCFSSGPCRKHPGWTLQGLGNAELGRSHRATGARAKLQQAIDLTHEILQIPDDYRIAIMPGSDTGAVEAALWSLLGARGVDVLAWDAFGERWMVDIVTELKIPNVRTLRAGYGDIVDLAAVNFDHDVVFTWNGTSSGVRVPNGDWIAADRNGLTICDATSAAFAQRLDWPKLDVTTFSWQKALGGEAAHGMLILGPRAIARLETYRPVWPLPKIFRLTEAGKVIDGLFAGETINTPSMLCVEDYLDALDWAKALGGLDALIARADANLAILADWVGKSDWVDFLVTDARLRSNTSVCLKITDPVVAERPVEAQAAFVGSMLERLAAEAIAYDIGSYRTAPPGLRIWCGATVESADLAALTAWLDFAFAAVKADAARAS